MSDKPQLDERIKGREGYGLIQVITGNGKGKTTSALGQLIRNHGVKKRGAILFFDKGGSHYSERSVLSELGIDWLAYGRDRIDPDTGKFDFSVTDHDKTQAEIGLEKARELIASNAYDLVVLDEINSTVDLGMLAEERVLTLLAEKPDKLELVLTGRNAPESFLKKAHLVTEASLVKHYFYSGVPAREGLDF